MYYSRHPLRINVGFLINQPVGSSRDIALSFPSILINPDLNLVDFNGNLRVGRTQQGIYVRGDFDAGIESECVRCLESFIQPLHTEFYELFAFTHRSVTEMGLILPDDANIDLGPLVREYMSIEIPISPLCKPDCKGLCPICGEDLNVNICEHQSRNELSMDHV